MFLKKFRLSLREDIVKYGKVEKIEASLRQLSGLVAESRPAALKAFVQTLGWKPKNFQTWLSSAETQQPVNSMRCKVRGCLVLFGVLC